MCFTHHRNKPVSADSALLTLCLIGERCSDLWLTLSSQTQEASEDEKHEELEKKDENEMKGGKKGKKVTAKPPKVCDSYLDEYKLF